eukprot:3226336-Prymnesium_polylepis.1
MISSHYAILTTITSCIRVSGAKGKRRLGRGAPATRTGPSSVTRSALVRHSLTRGDSGRAEALPHKRWAS